MAKYGLVSPRNKEEADYIAAFTWQTYKLFPMQMDAVYGIIDVDRQDLVGSAMFSQFNGYNCELNYYGIDMLTLGMVRQLASEILKTSIIRVTIRAWKPAVIKGAKKFGFIEEGTEEHF